MADDTLPDALLAQRAVVLVSRPCREGEIRQFLWEADLKPGRLGEEHTPDPGENSRVGGVAFLLSGHDHMVTGSVRRGQTVKWFAS